MMIAVRIVGFLLTGLSAVVLFIAFKGLVRANRYVRSVGADEPIPLDLKARMIIWGWVAGLTVGITLIAASY